MKPDDAFRVLLWLMLVISEVPAVPVPPPTDVEVSCRNLEVKVRWNYSSPQPQGSFGLTVTGPTGVLLQDETVERQYDLTSFVWSEENYMSHFSVGVTATVGGNRSQPAFSKTFTFNRVKTADRMCQLEFPPAELLREDLKTTLRIKNPFHLYRELEQATRRNLQVTATLVTGSEEDFTCSADNQICTHNVVIPDGVKDCVTLTGVIFDGNNNGHVKLDKTEQICAVAVSETPWTVIGITVFVCIAIILTVVIAVVKNCTLKPPVDLSVVTEWFSTKKSGLGYATVTPVDTCVVHTAPRKFQEPSLTSSENLGDSKDREWSEGSRQELAAMGGHPEEGYREEGFPEEGHPEDGYREEGFPEEGFPEEGYREEGYREEGFPEGHADDDSADNSENTVCVSVHSEESGESEREESVYERRNFPLDMGNGEVAIGYKE